jgi:hypothetical protein
MQQYQFDAYKEMEAVDEFLHGVLAAARRQQRHLGLLFVETFRSCFNDPETCDKSCGKLDQGRQGVFNTTIAGAHPASPWLVQWLECSTVLQMTANLTPSGTRSIVCSLTEALRFS